MIDHSATSYLAAIDHLRRELYLEPLTLAQEQSAMVKELLPHYLAAHGQGDAELAEQIALGMMAGRAFATMVIEGWEPELPRDLLLADEAYVSMMVTSRKAPGSAWGEHVIVYVCSV